MQLRVKYILGSLLLWLVCLSPAIAQQQWFENAGERLSGHYLVPEKRWLSDDGLATKGVIVFVHGDGPTSYDAEGFYTPIWDYLHQQGYAIFSWDKPGVGQSTGNWLDQSMLDRQQEVSAAIKFLQQRLGYADGQISLFGFSQAGWVAPTVAANNNSVGCIIGIGFAVNWLEQSWYLTKSRLQVEGQSPTSIVEHRAEHLKEIALLKSLPSYQQYLAHHSGEQSPMSSDRYAFVLKNFLSDGMQSYRKLDKPFLLLLGAEDQNVDVQQTLAKLSPLVLAGKPFRIELLANATHSLLNAQRFDAEFTTLSWLKFIWMEQEAFATGFFPLLGHWLSRECPSHLAR